MHSFHEYRVTLILYQHLLILIHMTLQKRYAFGLWNAKMCLKETFIHLTMYIFNGYFKTVLRIKGCSLWNELWPYQQEFRHAYFQKFTDDFLKWKILCYVTLYSQSVWKFGFCWFFSFGSTLRAETTERPLFLLLLLLLRIGGFKHWNVKMHPFLANTTFW